MYCTPRVVMLITFSTSYRVINVTLLLLESILFANLYSKRSKTFLIYLRRWEFKATQTGNVDIKLQYHILKDIVHRKQVLGCTNNYIMPVSILFNVTIYR